MLAPLGREEEKKKETKKKTKKKNTGFEMNSNTPAFEMKLYFLRLCSRASDNPIFIWSRLCAVWICSLLHLCLKASSCVALLISLGI